MSRTRITHWKGLDSGWRQYGISTSGVPSPRWTWGKRIEITRFIQFDFGFRSLRIEWLTREGRRGGFTLRKDDSAS